MNPASGERCQEVDLGMIEEVVVFALEAGMRLLFDLEDNITCFDAGQLVTLASEFDLCAALDASVDVHVQHFALDDGFLATALLASVAVADDLALALTVRADGLEALNHGAHLSHHGLHATAVTAGTLLNRAFLAADTVAFRADDRFLQRKLRDLAPIDIFQADFVDVGDRSSLLWAGVPHSAAEHAAETSTTAKELREEVLGSHARTARTGLYAFFTILVVELAFLRIRQNLIGVGEFFELDFGFGALVLVF